MEEEILKGKNLLVVDDEVDLRDIVASELEFMGAKVFQAENITNAQKILNAEKIDLIVSDIRMPGGTGVDLLNIVKSKNVNVPPVILITGFADITLEDAFDKGAEALLNKPFKLDDLIKLAVRYTSPFEERFKEEVSAQQTIHAEVDEGSVRFGRGGLALPILVIGRKVDVGEAVNFDFNFDHQQYKGRGICRWQRPMDHGSNKVLMGLEFLNLTNVSLASFLKNLEGKSVIPYIPSLKN
jgi:CheY-like chemotaxis protein